MTLPGVELPPHIRAVLARAGAEDGLRAAQGDLDRDCRAAGCDCEYCVAFGRAMLGEEVETLTDVEVTDLQQARRIAALEAETKRRAD